jgi:hypothetical protein
MTRQNMLLGKSYKMHKLIIASAGFLLLSASILWASSVMAGNKPPAPHGQMILEAVRISSPVTFCGEPVPLDNPDVRERLERELVIALDSSDSVIMWLKRSNRYFPEIEKTLKSLNLPDDLKYIAIAESSLRPHAYSPKGAAGYWQFIEDTGLKYGLQITNNIDERRNFQRATGAALAYLRDLYALFNSWTLAAAAYNMGEDGLGAEILVQQVHDYYRLHLNQETSRYIFRILAAKIILSDPARFGYAPLSHDLYHPIPADTVEIKTSRSVPLHIIAQAAKTYFKVIKDLNPQIIRYHLPAGNFLIQVPRGAAGGFSQRFEKLEKQWAAQKDKYLYTVQKGDTLTGIAARFNVPYRALLIWNEITGGKKIMPGERLYIFMDSAYNRSPLEDSGIDIATD